ncbi:MAG: hypothetical protein H7A49_00160 [Akkermansiaceae bacterium]|nr:hypothetical protein [Akkermansiaceae bacterium]MCP5542295.1 hypothetical protein [Akkermansiaceae bacterium]MCP5546168.1 hypothetical protein [Akkermansiaceae bacterium]
MKNTTIRSLLLGALLLPQATFAANPSFAPGDLVIHFQQRDGTSQRVYARLGSAALDFRGATTGPGAPDMLNIVNINAELTSAFGANWKDDDNLFVSVAGIYTNLSTPVAVNGDPGRTLYVGSPRTSVGAVGVAASAQKNTSGNTAHSSGANAMLSMLTTDFENNGSDNKEVIDSSPNKLLENHPFVLGGSQGTAYGTFPGGVQQQGSASAWGTFGGAGEVEFAIDLYRIYADTFNTDANRIEGPLRQGTFEGTITVDAAGNVSFLSQSAAGPFDVAVDSITTGSGSVSGKKVTINFTASGDVDVYASDNLSSWSKIGTSVTASPFVEDNVADSKRFFVLVKAGETYPPAP